MNTIRITTAVASAFLSVSAFAQHDFETEANLFQDKGLQMNGTVRWVLPQDDKVVFRWGPSLTLGSTENTILNESGKTESRSFENIGVGWGVIQKMPDASLSGFSELNVGLDCFGLKSLKNNDARHLTFKTTLGIRLENPSGPFYSLGLSFLSRKIPKNDLIMVNGVQLTEFSLTPSFAFGIRF